MLKTFKNLIFAIIFLILFLEIVAYSLSNFDNTEMFNVRSFTEKTNDKRLYMLKSNFFSKKWDSRKTRRKRRIFYLIKPKKKHLKYTYNKTDLKKELKKIN